MYYELINEHDRSKVIEFEGSHYIHIKNKDKIVKLIKV